jgi:hypothetical protein
VLWDRVSRLVVRLGLAPSLIRYAVLLFVLSRAGFVVVTLLALRFLRRIDPHVTSFQDAWARYDATYYARLAIDGYQPSVLWRTAFFPAQPLAIHLSLPLTGGNPYVAGLLVANISFLVALLGLGALATHDAGEAAARRAMLYLTVFPTGLFLFAGYAEALYLALAVWCLVALRRGAWWPAGALGLAAAFTRQMGLLLVLPFAGAYAARIRWRWRGLRPDALAVALIPGGLLLFMALLWRSVGDPLAFVHAEGYWQHSTALPWATLARAWHLLFRQPDAIFLFKGVVDFAMVLLFLGLIVAGARLLPPGETAYSAAVWLLALCYPTAGWPLQSDARYMLAALPCFLVLARLGHRRWLHVLIAVGFGLLLLVMTQYFVRGAVIV